MNPSRHTRIANLAIDGQLDGLKALFRSGYTQLELDEALETALAYSRIEMASYLLSLGADISNYNYSGVYYAVHNNELEGLKFAIGQGVDINVNEGMLINESIVTAFNQKDLSIPRWLLENGADPDLILPMIMESFGTPELRKLIDEMTGPKK